MANPEPQQESCCFIELNEEWVNSLKNKARDAYQSNLAEEHTICKVPQNIRKQDPDACEAQIVSLGPYHQSKQCLQAMNDIRLNLLSFFLQKYPHVALERYLRELKTLEKKARSSYLEDIKMESNEFVEMLLLDGCFVVEFLHQFEEEDYRHPFFKTSGAWNSIINDMLMLENQLPFFVLESIFDLAISTENERSKSLTRLAFNLCNSLFRNRIRMPVKEGESVPRFYHLLHFLHSCLAPASAPAPAPAPALKESVPWFHHLLHFPRFCSGSTERPQQQITKLPMPVSIPAIQLAEAGVKFRTTEEGCKGFFDRFPIITLCSRGKASLASSPERVQKSDEKSLLDITFVDGVLSIPTLIINDKTSSLLRNLMAFEHWFPDQGNHVAAYSEFMDFIIDTPLDVALLLQNKVIVNNLGSDKDVAVLFENLCKGVVINTELGHLSGVFHDVTMYHNSRYKCRQCWGRYRQKWPRYRQKLKDDYFNSPWSIISFLAAVILLLLTAIQAAFSVLPYFKLPK